MAEADKLVRAARCNVDISKIVRSTPVDEVLRAHMRETRAILGQMRKYAKAFEEYLSDKEGEDKLTSFEIQDLMSRYNQAEALAAAVTERRDCTADSIISKIG